MCGFGASTLATTKPIMPLLSDLIRNDGQLRIVEMNGKRRVSYPLASRFTSFCCLISDDALHGISSAS